MKTPNRNFDMFRQFVAISCSCNKIYKNNNNNNINSCYHHNCSRKMYRSIVNCVLMARALVVVVLDVVGCRLNVACCLSQPALLSPAAAWPADKSENCQSSVRIYRSIQILPRFRRRPNLMQQNTILQKCFKVKSVEFCICCYCISVFYSIAFWRHLHKF